MAANIAKNLAKYKRNAGAAVTDYVEGVQGVKTAPTHQAAAAVDKYARGVQDAVTSGAYVDGCMAVSLSDWQAAATGKGKDNYSNGIRNLSPKAQKAMADQQTYADQVKQEVANMPSDTPADMDARMKYAVDRMREYRKR